MNSFSHALFTLLFGWVRALVQGIWSAAAQGKLSRFLIWLGDHWLLLAGVLCLLCTGLDYVVWLIRWRPYLAWRTRVRRFFRRLRGGKIDSRRRFSQGYAEAVPLDMPEAAPPPADWERDAGYPPEMWQTPPAAPAPAPEYAPYPPPEMQPAPETESGGAQYRYFSQPEAYEPPPVYTPSRADAAFSSDMPAARRKRRSEKYDKRKASWRERLMPPAEEEEAMLDGLPPAVDRETAFHEPVYPNYPAPYDAWQHPKNPTNGQ